MFAIFALTDTMEYNTQRPRLQIREYGRIIQKMVQAVAREEDEEKRNRMARALVELMAQTNPQAKQSEEFRHKLWDHLIMMSDFKLVVDSPYPFPERRSVVTGGAAPLPYPRRTMRYRHYGRNLETLVGLAKTMDEDKRRGLAVIAANYMKLCYANWSKETVSDEMIKQDLRQMSGGLLTLDEDFRFDPNFFNMKLAPQQQGKTGKRKKKIFAAKFRRNR
ncbi:MAG: DUF4290 domain-containing protein [Chitinophagales bacterium]|nr:DUF4290 domain-containing protein [Chitinophagales bacterium]